jgi:hypothetical protein
LYLAARESETAVDEALRVLIDRNESIDAEAVKAAVCARRPAPVPATVAVAVADLGAYDTLLTAPEVAR